MGFNEITLLELIFGLLIPLAVIIFFLLSKNRGNIAYDSIAYGFASFLASVIVVFIIFTIANMLFLSSFEFGEDSSGMATVGIIICVMIAILFAVCETLKIMTIKKFQKNENRFLLPGVGFSAGVIIAQNACLFVALNIYNRYEMDTQYALYSGAILCVTGIMYLVLSWACESIVKSSASTAPAYAISSVYYLFWIAAIAFSGSTVLLYISSVFFFILAFVLSGVFLFKTHGYKNIIGDQIDK
ncbi:MAG: hypothetical protein J6K66_05760 [Clostridia bacterium]|nr:hypothetical protein [Clostridia bacterium]